MSAKKILAKPAKVVKKTAVKKIARRRPVARNIPSRVPEFVLEAPISDLRPSSRHEPVSEPESRASARVVYLAGCRNCNHLPLGASMVVTVLVAIVFTLSAMLMAASVTLRGNATDISAYRHLLNPAAYATATKSL